MPDQKTDATPAAAPVLELTDHFTGLKTPAYLGGDPLPEIPTGGDRGDDLVSTPSVPGTLVSGSAAGALADAAAKAAEDEAAAEAELAAAAAKVLSDAEKAALPKRDEAGKFEAKDPETKGDEPKIPKARLDKEIERRKAAEARLAEKDAAEAAAAKGEAHTFDFDAAETAYMDLLLDGKLQEATAKRKEIRAAERAENEAIIDQRSERTATRNQTKTVIQDIGDRYEADYAEFNPESKTFDELAMAQVKAIYGGFLEQGLFATPDTAFAAALETVVKANGFSKVAGDEPEPTPKTLPPARTAADRIAAIGSQPPSIAAAGQSSAARGAHEVDVSTLTEDQLAKLPQATLRRLRGDEL